MKFVGIDESRPLSANSARTRISTAACRDHLHRRCIPSLILELVFCKSLLHDHCFQHERANPTEQPELHRDLAEVCHLLPSELAACSGKQSCHHAVLETSCSTLRAGARPRSRKQQADQHKCRDLPASVASLLRRTCQAVVRLYNLLCLGPFVVQHGFLASRHLSVIPP